MAIYFEGLVLYSFILLYFIIALIMKFKFKKSFTYILFFTIMYIYFCNVINLTQFPIYIDDDQRKAFGGQNVWKEMNFIPLRDGFSMTSFYNILMTVPLGFGLPFITKASFKKIFFVGLFAGILFETGQLLSALYAGYTFRFVDIDDVIFNLSGALIGYLILFKLFKFIFNFCVKKFNLKPNAIINHIHNT
ncbi:VanZ family protein [Priestia megaterium]|uniref:VanZ family protein n=1 Tax=Priestia megaterium TaxID=1404 RepID=UPI00288B827D|nr:VanZ family protein [Priestia megaterium]